MEFQFQLSEKDNLIVIKDLSFIIETKEIADTSSSNSSIHHHSRGSIDQRFFSGNPKDLVG
jgi:hypothetical protein